MKLKYNILYTLPYTVALILFPTMVSAKDITRWIEIDNQWETDRQDEPVVIKLKETGIDFGVRAVTVWDGDYEIPSQLDDLDGNGIMDELAFVTDMPAHTRKSLKVKFSSAGKQKDYPARVYAEMLLSDPQGKHIPIRSLTVPASSYVYNHLHHHGPAFESELVAYRIYFDKKQTVDIYGKFTKQLEIQKSQFYPTDEQLAQGFGDDVLLVGNSCGLGTLKGWNGSEATHIENTDAFTETIRSYGPVRTVVDVCSHHWKYQDSDLHMTVRYILYAGHRDCEVQIFFKEPLRNEIFCTGLLKMKDSNTYSDHKGTLACWGTDWPVNDTVKYAKETVGLAIAIPTEVVSEEVEDSVNRLYTIQAKDADSFSYHITFTSQKETFGYRNYNEWFDHVRRWSQMLKQPVTIRIIDK